MSESQSDILRELDALLGVKASGELSEDQRDRFETLVRDHPVARKRYLSYATVESQLHWRGRNNGEDTMNTPQTLNFPKQTTRNSTRWLRAAGFAIAASVAITALILFNSGRPDPIENLPEIAAGGSGVETAEMAAAATRFEHTSAFGDPIERGPWRILPSRDARLEIVSDALLKLTSGDLYVTHDSTSGSAEQMVIETPAGRVKPIGTRFFVSTYGEGTSEKPAESGEESVQKEGVSIEDVAVDGNALFEGIAERPIEFDGASSRSSVGQSMQGSDPGGIPVVDSNDVEVNVEAPDFDPAPPAVLTESGNVVTNENQQKTNQESEMKAPVIKGQMTRVFVLAGMVMLANDAGQNQAGAGELLEAQEGKAPQKLQAEGNFKEAYDIYARLVVDPAHGGKECAEDVLNALQCLQRLGQWPKWDDLAENVAKSHEKDWRVLYAVAQGYQRVPHYGSMVDNEFERGVWRGQGMDVSQRDRQRSLQLMQQALPFVADAEDKNAAAYFYRDFASQIYSHEAWRLQYLTDLSTLPDYGDPIYYDQTGGAPVDEEGNPVFHHLPESWEQASSDGERWRWLLHEMAETNPALANNAKMQFAAFLYQQFGVHTMGWAPSLDLEGEVEDGPYAVHTLKENETIARLATGVKRFELPDEFNYIRIYQEIGKDLPPAKRSPLKDVKYKVYNGDWDKLPDFDDLKAAAEGVAKDNLIDIHIVPQRERYGMVFTGTLSIAKAGKYTFSLDSDDGSRLLIDGKAVITLDGLRGMGQRQTATVDLAAGEVPVRVEYFEKTGNEGLMITMRDPDGAVHFLSTGEHNANEVSQSIEQLASIFENRLQYDKAAEQWETVIGYFGPGHNGYRRQRLSQIVDPWGRIDHTSKLPAGAQVNLSYIFRNGPKVNFKATTIKVEDLLTDIKDYLKSNPNDFDWQRININQIGERLVRRHEQKYLGEQAASWSVDLEPRPKHWDRRVEIKAPLEEAGAYLVEATMADGNTSRVIVWITNTALVGKPLDQNMMYFVADAMSGKPVANANVEFFGYYMEHLNRQQRLANRTYNIHTSNFAENTNEDGIAIPEQKMLDNKYQWLVVARDKESGRLGVHGFEGIWRADYNEQNYQASKAYIFADRPVYRPDQEVHFKAWVRAARYDMAYISHFAGRKFRVLIHDPMQQVLYDKELVANEYGAVTDSINLDENASLGHYQVIVTERNYVDPFTKNRQPERHLGGTAFRVEEYKKPEFEVTVDAPDEPIALGDSFEATVKAKYYFGAPVTNARVKYTVKRYEHQATWIPPRDWDWLYGRGYWWFTYNYEWYPGWNRWGCYMPGWFRPNPPEIVAQDTVDIGEDGTAKIRVDSSVAKELFGHLDHRYEVTAEVVDESRRTIVGSGSVIAAREPFKVYAWLDGGHYRVGDTIEAHFRARTPDDKPVAGKGTVILYRVMADAEGEVTEEAVNEWDVEVDASGSATLKMEAEKAGQYRIACKVTSKKGHIQEGATLTVVTGPDLDADEEGGFRFNDLELVLDKAEYEVGEQVRLMVNTDQKDSTVLLFIRPVNGIYRKPEVIRVNGKSIVRSIDITTSDMPNIYVEAVTIANGEVHAEVKQIVVPPAKRVLTVDVAPSDTEYQPKDVAKVKIKLTDINGEPFTGETVVSVYDKSIEYIAGGHPSGDIREFFWKWQRHHSANNRHSMSMGFNQLFKDGETGMGNIGVFGNLLGLPEDQLMELGLQQQSNRPRRTATRGLFGGGGRGGEMAMMAMESEGKAAEFAADAAPAPQRKVVNDVQDDWPVLTKSRAGSGGASAPEVEVRSDFADSAFWTGSVVTNSEGIAEIDIPMPENLTTWKIHAWGMGHGTVVGQGSAEVITSKDLLVRLQAPRFFVQKDEVVLSANVHNYTDGDKEVRVSLGLLGDALELLDGANEELAVNIKAGGDQRIDWRIKVKDEGEAVVRMTAITDDASDTMEMTFPSFVHGMLKTDSYSAAIRPGQDETSLTVKVPDERRPEESHLEVRYSPSIALAMVDALPYLAHYEYRHSESAISRFVPLMITRKLLMDMGVDLEEVRKKQINLNPQEIGDARKRAAQWKKWDNVNPVFDNDQVDSLMKKSLRDLAGLQRGDGGFGWAPGNEADPHSTAYVVHGLLLAREAGVALVPGMVERGIQYLANHQQQEVQKLINAATETKPWKNSADNLDAFVAMVLTDAGQPNRQMLDFLYRDRLKLSVYAQAMAGLAFDKVEMNEQRDMVIRNIEQFKVEDKENQTVYLDLPNRGYWWWWYGNENEAHAFYLKLLTRVDPKGDRASGLAKYLLNNRKHATWWSCTRDTAIAIEALGEFVRASGEKEPDMDVSILVDGKVKKQIHIDADNLFTFDNVLTMKGLDLTAGEHKIEVKRDGQGPLYVNAYLTNFTLEDFITKAGLEVKVERRYYKLVEKDLEIAASGSRGQVTGYKVEKYERVPLKVGDEVTSGDMIEVELLLESKNDYEHLLFEDYKAAGLEPVDLNSGYIHAGQIGAYREFRDEKVAFLVRRLPRGKHSMTYRLRAEIPGKFSALPTRAIGVYAEELRGNSDEMKIIVKDKE